ncbi:hypothetical protein RHJ80_08575 [Thermosynechococcus sp. QS41]|uniref:hypothetical protein n=1 Tax=Thermosynechococcus sp. QS41 TaxID=3074101 RepID=UPI0028777F20|nr:hypothetical protein [Thermosynechococcus sp. QS41]WNC59531.1 hypothetical protein RHJ80_08575 [Thermosynechococcus sp. QS41]
MTMKSIKAVKIAAGACEVGMRYFVEVSFRCDDDAIWDILTRHLGFVEAKTLEQAMALHHFFEMHPLVSGVETFVQSSDSQPYLLMTTYPERISKANVQRSRFQEAMSILGEHSPGLAEWLFMETTGDEY